MNNLSLCSGKASSLREAGKMFNVPHCSVSELVKYRKQGRHGVGKKLKYLSEQEEKHIAERYIFAKFCSFVIFFSFARVRSSATDSTEVNYTFVKKIYLEEIEILKINFPERAEMLGQMNKMNVRAFIDRHNLCKEYEEQRRRYLDEKRSFECEVCHKLYSDKKYILKHMRTVHSFLFT